MKNCCTYWFKGSWNDSCCQHDKDYYQSGLSRKTSDTKLFKGVFTSLDNRVEDLRIWRIKFPTRLLFNLFGRVISFPVASIMWVAVFFGGRSRYTRKQGELKNGT